MTIMVIIEMAAAGSSSFPSRNLSLFPRMGSENSNLLSVTSQFPLFFFVFTYPIPISPYCEKWDKKCMKQCFSVFFVVVNSHYNDSVYGMLSRMLSIVI